MSSEHFDRILKWSIPQNCNDGEGMNCALLHRRSKSNSTQVRTRFSARLIHLTRGNFLHQSYFGLRLPQSNRGVGADRHDVWQCRWCATESEHPEPTTSSQGIEGHIPTYAQGRCRIDLPERACHSRSDVRRRSYPERALQFRQCSGRSGRGPTSAISPRVTFKFG